MYIDSTGRKIEKSKDNRTGKIADSIDRRRESREIFGEMREETTEKCSGNKEEIRE